MRLVEPTIYGTDAYAVDDGDDDLVATDDVRGGVLPPVLVRKARAEEIAYIHARKIYAYAQKAECYQRTGRPPLRLKWIDTNKGGKALAVALLTKQA